MQLLIYTNIPDKLYAIYERGNDGGDWGGEEVRVESKRIPHRIFPSSN